MSRVKKKQVPPFEARPVRPEGHKGLSRPPSLPFSRKEELLGAPDRLSAAPVFQNGGDPRHGSGDDRGSLSTFRLDLSRFISRSLRSTENFAEGDRWFGLSLWRS